ncbi:MAG: VanZ family protein [Acutalibacteraceae bacterium]|nr:VanZ family protein [Acutalibacteraceae bacterium]
MRKINFERKNIKKYIFIFIIGLTILFIWSNSMKVSDYSMNDSNGIKELIISFFGSFGIDVRNSFFIEFIRKIGHFSEYFILGVELMIFKIIYLKNNINSLVNTFFIGVFSAFLDETIQLIPALGRSSQVTDVWIDIFGILTAFLLVFAVNFFVNFTKKDKS